MSDFRLLELDLETDNYLHKVSHWTNNFGGSIRQEGVGGSDIVGELNACATFAFESRGWTVVKDPLVNICAHVLPWIDETVENKVSMNQSPFRHCRLRCK
jgi:hypothetical protein